MIDDTIPERVPTPAEQAPDQQPESAPHDDSARQQTPPSIVPGEPEIDIVDFQSMQSFPASDAPAWPAPEPARSGGFPPNSNDAEDGQEAK